MKNIQILNLVVLFVMKNINQKENVKHVNQDILRQKMNLVYIAEMKNMVALHAKNVKKMKVMEILFVKIVKEKIKL